MSYRNDEQEPIILTKMPDGSIIVWYKADDEDEIGMPLTPAQARDLAAELLALID